MKFDKAVNKILKENSGYSRHDIMTRDTGGSNYRPSGPTRGWQVDPEAQDKPFTGQYRQKEPATQEQIEVWLNKVIKPKFSQYLSAFQERGDDEKSAVSQAFNFATGGTVNEFGQGLAASKQFAAEVDAQYGTDFSSRYK